MKTTGSVITQPTPPARERFVPADVAARFTGIKRRHLLALARKGLAGSYPIGEGRKTWVFRISELENAITGRVAR